MSTVDDLSKQILADVVADFRAKDLGSSALSEGYVGPSIVALGVKYCAHSKVDFDLALKQLEEGKFIDTGPMVPFDNKPGSQLVFVGVVSKREFVCLTEKGYRAAQKSVAKPTSGQEQVSGADADRKFARLAIDEARKSIAEDGRPHPKVGAVVVKDGKVLSTAHRGEMPGDHAEYVALEKKLSDEAIAGATVYTTLEPCTTRTHPKVPCAERLIERRAARVVMGMLDPDVRITGRGQRTLRSAGIVTDFFPPDLMAEAEELNREFTRFCEQNVRTEVGPANMELWKEVAGLRKEFSEFKQSTEKREKDRAEFENLPVGFVFDQGSPGSFSGNFKNDSKYKVSVEAIQILRGDVDYESPLTDAVKPRPTEDWTVEPGQSKTLFWGPQHDPINMLRSLVQSSDPNFPQGKVIPFALWLTFTADGKRHNKKFVRQMLVQGNQLLSWGP